MKTTIVTTTINVPVMLAKYARNARDYGHTDVNFIVIGDRKTPTGARDCCDDVTRQYLPCEYLDLAEQKSYLAELPELWEHLPVDSIQRRNVGLIKAWADGADLIITIDDDNFLSNQDFVGAHALAGTRATLPLVESTSGWYNVCAGLSEQSGAPFYHRGYPMEQRWNEHQDFTTTAVRETRVAVNAGFWLDDPDIDALTRMYRQPVVTGRKPGFPKRFGLEPGTWSPFNSQNTALARDVMPAYFLSPYVGRYDDIWPSYLVVRIAEHLHEVVAYGDPIVRQKRNAHNLWRDLDNERFGMQETTNLCQALRSITLTGTTYHECYGQLATALPGAWQEGPKWTPEMRASRERFLEGLRIWHLSFDRLGVSSVNALARQTQSSVVPVTDTALTR